MMGRLNHEQEQFFYSFRLDDAVPGDHPVRRIAAVLDLGWVYSELAPYYPEIGRPSVDPVLMIRMLIVDYVFGIRSERVLCRDVAVNLAYRWFCGLSIEDKVPDHSVFSRARNERFGDCGIFRTIFERVVGACIGAGLVGGEGFAVDASLIVAAPTSSGRSAERSGARRLTRKRRTEQPRSISPRSTTRHSARRAKSGRSLCPPPIRRRNGPAPCGARRFSAMRIII